MFRFSMLAKTISMTIAVFAFASANADDLPESAKAPAEAMAKLGALQGTWKTVTEIAQEDGGWLEQSANIVAIKKSLRGLLLTESEVKRTSGDETSLGLKIDYTFDQYRKVYRVSVVDDGWGIMDIYEGGLEDGALTLTNIRSGTSFPLDDDGEMFFHLAMPVAGDWRVLDINMSTDKGESWRPFYRVTYTREKQH